MNVREFAEKMGMKILTPDTGMDKDVTGMYICDLLSWVMSHASRGDAWITVHTHINIVAVALLAEISCIILPEGICAEEAAISRATQEGIAILSTGMTAYEVCIKARELIKN